MNKKNKENRSIVLYGAGTQNLRMVYQPLVSTGNIVEYICDADEQKQGKEFEGVKIISPLELEQLAQTQLLEIIITVRTEQVVNEIKSWLDIYLIRLYIPLMNLLKNGNLIVT